jgi:hypothetical protein
MDISVHWQAAKAINDRASTDSPHFELMLPSAPLLVHWLAFWQRLLGDESVTPHRILNALLGALNAALVYLVLCILLGGSSPVAISASLVWAGLPSLIFFDTALHKSVISVLILLTLLLLILRRTQLHSPAALACEGTGLGLLLSLLFLCQLNTFLFVVAVVPVLVFDSKATGYQRAWRALPVVIVLLMIFLTFQFRKEVFHQKFPWYLPQKGIHLRIGNQAAATEGYSAYKEIADFPFGHVFQARLYAETVLERRLSPWEADQLLTDEAIQFTKENPLQALDISAKKLLGFFNNFEQKGVNSLYQIKIYSKILRHDPLGLGILVLFSGLGVIRLLVRKEYRLLYLLLALLSSVLISNLMAFMTWRYRLLALVPLVLLAGLGASLLCEVLSTVRTTGRTRLPSALVAAMLGSLLACGWLAFRPEPKQVREAQIEVARRNEIASAVAERRLARLGDFDAAERPREAQLRRAALLFGVHRFTEAFNLFASADACRPPVVKKSVCGDYLRLLIWLGDYQTVTEILNALSSHDSQSYGNAVESLTKLEGKVLRLFIHPRVEGVEADQRRPHLQSG